MFLPMQVREPTPNYEDWLGHVLPQRLMILAVIMYLFISDVLSADSSHLSGLNFSASGPKMLWLAWATQLFTPTSV